MTDLAKLLDEYGAAQREYEDAERVESTARGRKCSALNRLNEAQKAIDRFVEEQRKAAPRDSDWKRNKNYGALKPT